MLGNSVRLGERGQVVIPKKIRESLNLGKGDELEAEISQNIIILRPVNKFKAVKWQDYIGIGNGIADSYLEDKKKGKRH